MIQKISKSDFFKFVHNIQMVAFTYNLIGKVISENKSVLFDTQQDALLILKCSLIQ